MPINLLSAGGGTTTLTAASSASNFTVTIPSATTTMVGTDATQTLTNKTIQGGTVIQGTAQTTTSGTAIDFTGIPSWAKRVTVLFSGVSTSGTAQVIIQIGTSGGLVTTGYLGGATFNVSGATFNSNSTGFRYEPSDVSIGSSSLRHGEVRITNITGNTWVCAVTNGYSGTNGTSYGGGTLALSGVLDRLRITTTGSDTFDAGTINILYE